MRRLHSVFAGQIPAVQAATWPDSTTWRERHVAYCTDEREGERNAKKCDANFRSIVVLSPTMCCAQNNDCVERANAFV